MTRFKLVLVLLSTVAMTACDRKQEAPSTAPAAAPPASTAGVPATATAAHSASGKIEAVDPVAGTLKISHGPVASLAWPAMTMDFSVSDKALLNDIKSGQNIEFDFIEQGSDYVVTAIR